MTTYSGGHCGVADYVTGLQTRGDLESCLRVHLEHDGDQQPLLVALGVDIIGLKQINDTSGFLAGDKHLAAAAAKLVDATTLSHLQSRLGGDELPRRRDAGCWAWARMSRHSRRRWRRRRRRCTT